MNHTQKKFSAWQNSLESGLKHSALFVPTVRSRVTVTKFHASDVEGISKHLNFYDTHFKKYKYDCGHT